MHQSDDESRQAAIVTCYLDESGTQEGAPIAVVGELLLNKANFASLDAAWWPMLVKHSIEPPLHMKDFRRPGGDWPMFQPIATESYFLMLWK